MTIENSLEEDLEKISHALSHFFQDNDPIFERVARYADLKKSFDFDFGHNRATWSLRTNAISAQCENCGFRWIAGFLPMPSKQLNCILERTGVCARCCEAERVIFNEVNLKRVNNSASQMPTSRIPVFRHKAS